MAEIRWQMMTMTTTYDNSADNRHHHQSSQTTHFCITRRCTSKMEASHQATLFILLGCSSFLSSVGSLMIISQISCSRFNRTKPQQRIVFGISVCDLLSSLAWLFSPLLMHSGDGDYWVHGNQASCSFQGFVLTLFVYTAVFYQCSLQLQYLLVIKYGWSQRRMKSIERYLHAFPWCYGFMSAITNLALKMYNPGSWNW